MHKHIIIYVCLLFSLVAHAVNADNSLSELRKCCEEARSLSQYKTLEKYSSTYLDKARTSGDKSSESFACFYNGLAKLFLGKTAEADKMFDVADRLAMQTSNDTVKALVLNARGISEALNENNNFVAQAYFFKSIELAKKINYEDLQMRVQGNLLMLSQSMDDSTAFENATAVYEYGVKHGNMEQINMGAYYLATYYYNHSNYSETEKYLRTTIDLYDKNPYEDIASVYDLYAKMLMKKGDIVNAEDKAMQALKYVKQYNQPSIQLDVYITLARLFTIKKQYSEAIRMIQDAMDIAEKSGLKNKAADCNRIMADCYLSMGQTTEAVKYLQMANDQLEEKATINMERITHEQQVMRDIERKEMEDEAKREKISYQHKILMALATSVVFLLLLLIVIIVNYRRRQILYKKIVLQNSRAVIRQKELQEQIAELTREENKRTLASPSEGEGYNENETHITPLSEAGGLNSKASVNDEKTDVLYKELCRLMDKERLFAEPQLTRERMAERLNTNRTYLTQVIKKKTGMSYLQFVNSYRINEAIRILSDKDNSTYPLKQLWSDLGFSSPSTFYKLFQQAVGITPSVYRKQFLEVNEENDLFDADE